MPDHRVEAKRAYRPYTADTQHDLLRDTHLVVAAIESRREHAVAGCVRLDIGIHQIERDAPHLDTPDLGVDLAPGQVYANHDFMPLGVQRGLGGNLREEQLLVDGLLLALGVDALAKVALRIEEADTDEGKSEVARLFAVVAREDAQAAGVDGQRFV